jgi:hypothetical protein
MKRRGHYHDHDEKIADPLAKDLLVGAGAPATTGENHDRSEETRPGKVVVEA